MNPEPNYQNQEDPYELSADDRFRLHVFTESLATSLIYDIWYPAMNTNELDTKPLDEVSFVNLAKGLFRDASREGYSVWEMAEIQGWDLEDPVMKGIVHAANVIMGKD